MENSMKVSKKTKLTNADARSILAFNVKEDIENGYRIGGTQGWKLYLHGHPTIPDEMYDIYDGDWIDELVWKDVIDSIKIQE